jgi:hypothetical protein
MKLDEELYVWFKENQESFASRCGEIEFKDFGRGSASVILVSEKYIASVSAWNRALCLDIEVLEVETEDCKFPHVGDCKSMEEFRFHLNEFLTWFNENMGKNA